MKEMFNDCLFELEERHRRREDKKWEDAQEYASKHVEYCGRYCSEQSSCCCHTNVWCEVCFGEYDAFN